MRRLALLLLLALPWSAPAQTTVRIKDADGKVVCELYVPAPGSVEIIPGPGPGPGPAPNPNPQPPPNPVPPGPAPVPQPPSGPAKHFVVIRDDTPGAMTAAQAAALRDPAVRTAVARQGLAWHVYDVGSTEVQQKPPAGLGYVKFLADLKAPCVLLLDAQGKLARKFALPADAAGIVATLGGQ